MPGREIRHDRADRQEQRRDAGQRPAHALVIVIALCSAREAPDRVAQHRTAVEAAVDAGVERLVYMATVRRRSRRTQASSPV